MVNVQSRLTKQQKKSLLCLLGCQHLSLLYQGSIHGYNANAFHSLCNRQGPTVVVAYNASGFIFGGFTHQCYTSSGRFLHDEKAFLFRLKGEEELLCPLKFPVRIADKAVYDVSQYGPYFGDNAVIFLSQYDKIVTTNDASPTYIFSAKDLHGNDQNILECEVYRVEDIDDLMENPWRKIDLMPETTTKLMYEIATYKPHLNLVQQIRVLFLGPVGAGKSSLFNSVNSVFRGYVASQAIAGSDSGSVTLQYRNYQVKDGRQGNPLPIIFCDTMGLEEKEGSGLDIDEVTNLVQGHVPDRYEFNPSVAMQPDSPGYVKSPLLKDLIHCVVFVIDGSKVEILPEKLQGKLREIRRKINKLDVPQLVILTKVDEVFPSLEEDLSNVYRSQTVMKQMEITARKLGIPLSQIFPVKNYCSEVELKHDADILILMAVRQMLRLGESYFDNFSPQNN